MPDESTTTTTEATVTSTTTTTDATVTEAVVRENAEKANNAFTNFKYGGDPFNPGIPADGPVKKEAASALGAGDPLTRITALEARVSALEGSSTTSTEGSTATNS